MSHANREERIGSRYLPRFFFAASSVLFIFLVIISWNIVTALPSERTTIAIAGDPVYVLSWDEVQRSLTVIPIPVDVYLDGVYGVGSLSVVSLRKLESLDAKKKGLFVKSLEDALALPINGVISIRDAPSFANSVLWGSGLPIPLRLRLWWILVGLRPDAVKLIDLESQGVFRRDVLADGSGIRVFDGNRYDAVIGNRLEVDSIRREEFRVRVVNTTDVLGLGNRAARTLSHAGMVVIAVESASPPQSSCTIHTKKELRDSKTNKFAQRIFHCNVTQSDADERADLTMRLGEDYAQRFKSD